MVRRRCPTRGPCQRVLRSDVIDVGRPGVRGSRVIDVGTPSYADGVPSSRLPYLTAKLQGFGTTIFAEMSALATSTGSVNLGQGFPDTDGPAEVLDVAVEQIRAGNNQYPPGPGMPVLRQAVAAHQQRFYGLEY